MAEISAGMVKELREKTGAGMMDCKKALAESAGDFAKAEEWLRKKGISRAEAKGSRVAAEGLVGVLVQGNVGVVVEVNSETDFVARNDEFKALVADMAAHIAKASPADVPALLEQPFAKEPGKKVKELMTEKVAKIGENLSVRRFSRFDAQGALGAYVHGGKIGVVVELAGASDPELAKEVAMQVAAARPLYVKRDEVPADVLEKEKEIHRAQLRDQKKPEAIWDKIITGKLEKYYETVCLMDQLWIKDDKKKIKDVLKGASVVRLARYEVGEGIEKKKDDLAAEVAKTLGR